MTFPVTRAFGRRKCTWKDFLYWKFLKIVINKWGFLPWHSELFPWWSQHLVYYRHIGRSHANVFFNGIHVLGNVIPSNYATPVMTHQNKFVSVEGTDDFANVTCHAANCVVIDIFRLIGFVVATHVESDAPVVFTEFFDLVSPTVPKFREAMDEYH